MDGMHAGESSSSARETSASRSMSGSAPGVDGGEATRCGLRPGEAARELGRDPGRPVLSLAEPDSPREMFGRMLVDFGVVVRLGRPVVLGGGCCCRYAISDSD